MNPSLDTYRGQGRKVLRVFGVLLVLLGSLRDAVGAPVAARHAAAAVQGWLAGDAAPLSATLGQKIKRTETFKDAAGTALYHVVYLDPAGFVIVAADDLIEPIIGFAPDGKYDPSTDNPLGALVGRDLPGRVAKVKGVAVANARGGLLAAKNKWAQLQSTDALAIAPMARATSVSTVRVAPLTQTLWSQSTVTSSGGVVMACYNYYTPPNAAGSISNYVSGCVATAMAQLMRYWQYPAAAVGTGSYSIKVNGVTQNRSLRGGDGLGGAYNWGVNMVNNPASSSLVQRQAIGNLCADAGVAVHMQYASGSSGAYMSDLCPALVGAFQYANAIYGTNAATGAALNGMINPNLDAGCPVLLGIYGSPGGHAVVCDGYGYTSSTLYHHLNLGWGGSNTAWYTLPTIDTTSGSFTTVDSCCYNIWSTGTGEIISGRITDTGGLPVAGVTMTATLASGGTYSATSNAQGIYALAKIPSSSQYTLGASKAGYGFANQTVTTGKSMIYAANSGNCWAVDFAATNNPTQFAAASANSAQIDLSWVQNPSLDNVLVAWSATNTFGTPAGTYAPGNVIAGGGTVLYNGTTPGMSHTGLAAGTKCYYKAWSVLAGGGYTSGVVAAATTARGVPFTEGFENGGTIPADWSQEYVTNSVNWTFQSGGHNGYPVSAHGGSYNALLYYSTTSDHVTKLVTPMFDCGANLPSTQLSFWHHMQVYAGQDQLKVYCKTAAGGSWTLLATYASSVTPWTLRTIALPSPGRTCWIAFEGNAKLGFGVCIDDVQVTTAPTITSASLLPPGTVGTAYSQVLAASGGTTPWAWAIATGSLPAGLSVSAAGVISGTPSAATTASFSVRVTGKDGLSSTKAFDLTVNEISYANWAGESGLTGNAALPESMPFGDGIANLLKYSCNMNGSGPDVRSLVAGTGTVGLPVLTRDVSGPMPVFRFEYLRRKVGGLVYSPVQSSSLSAGAWQPLTGTVIVTDLSGTWERVVIEHPYELGAPGQFLRLEVTQF